MQSFLWKKLQLDEKEKDNIMKNVLIGIAAGIAIGYVLRKMEDDGKFKCIHDDMSELADRAKKKIKDVVDKGVNEAEYIGDRVEHITDKVKKGATN